MSTNDKKVRLKIRLTVEEKTKLEHDAALCGLTQSEYLRQICLGKRPRPKQPPEFWEDYRPRSRQEQWAPQAED